MRLIPKSECASARCRLAMAVSLILPGAGFAAKPPASSGPLRVHPRNPRYFTDDSGKAIYLTGSHIWNNLQDTGDADPPAPLDYPAHLDWLARFNHNFTRGWAWEQPMGDPGNPKDFYITPIPFARTGPGLARDGKPKFDLTRYNDEYFERLRGRVQLAGRRGLYMGVMLFNGWSIEVKKKKAGNPWPYHPLNKANNINGIDGDPDGNNEGFETHALDVPAVTRVQEAYVRKVIDTLGDLDNVIWEITNESWEGSVQWQYHMINTIKAHEKTRPRQHLVWMTGYMVPNQSLFDSPAECISPCRKDGTNYRGNPPPTTGQKIVLLDTDHIWGIGGDYKWVWKSFTRGYHPIFMDPIFGLETRPDVDGHAPKWDAIRRAMGHTRIYAEKMDLAAMTPQPAVCSTTFCLATPGVEYLAYQPGSGAFTLELPPGDYAYEWFNVTEGKTAGTGTLKVAESRHEFTPPFSGDAVLWLRRSDATSKPS